MKLTKNFYCMQFTLLIFTSATASILFVDDSTEQFEEKYVSWDTDGQLYQETTYTPVNPNITLDTVNDTTSVWNIARTSIKKWFEYYDSTDHLNQSADNNTICANAISGYASQLQDVDGIWAACQDPGLPSDCHISVSTPCHPFIKCSFGNGNQPDKRLRTIKMKLFLHGLAIVRLWFGPISWRSGNCVDYSLQKDPFSPCVPMILENTSGTVWKEVKTPFDGYDNIDFVEVNIQLIARFKGDFALVDKIEGTNYRLCGEDDVICTTTPAGPTRTPPTLPPWTDTTHTETTTSWPETTTDAETTTPSTTTPTTTPTTTSPTTTSTTTSTVPTEPTPCRSVKAYYELTAQETRLDRQEDAERGSKWDVPEISPYRFEYYDDSASLIRLARNPNSCANKISSVVNILPDAVGLWTTCQITNCLEDQEICNPVINFSSNDQLIVSVTTRFYLHGSAVIRLHLENECLDYSVTEVANSPCQFMPIQDEIFWQGFYWSTQPQFAAFRTELISRLPGDVLLLDSILVKHIPCDNDDCSQQTTISPTTDCDEEETPTEEPLPCTTTEWTPTTEQSETSSTTGHSETSFTTGQSETSTTRQPGTPTTTGQPSQTSTTTGQSETPTTGKPGTSTTLCTNSTTTTTKSPIENSCSGIYSSFSNFYVLLLLIIVYILKV